MFNLFKKKNFGVKIYYSTDDSYSKEEILRRFENALFNNHEIKEYRFDIFGHGYGRSKGQSPVLYKTFKKKIESKSLANASGIYVSKENTTSETIFMCNFHHEDHTQNFGEIVIDIYSKDTPAKNLILEYVNDFSNFFDIKYAIGFPYRKKQSFYIIIMQYNHDSKMYLTNSEKKGEKSLNITLVPNFKNLEKSMFQSDAIHLIKKEDSIHLKDIDCKKAEFGELMMISKNS